MSQTPENKPAEFDRFKNTAIKVLFTTSAVALLLIQRSSDVLANIPQMMQMGIPFPPFR